MMKVDLGDGKFAVVREMADLKRRDVRTMYELVDEQKVDTTKPMTAVAAMRDAATTILIESWDFDVPVSMDSIGDLSLSAYDALKAAVEKTVDRVMELGSEPDPKSDLSLSAPAKTASSSRGRKSI